MFRNLSLRWKLLAILCIPLVLLGGTTTYIGVQANNAARQARVVQQLANTSVQFTQLIHNLQNERDRTTAYLLQHRSPALRPAMLAARAQVNAGLGWLTDQMKPGSPFTQLSPQAQQSLGALAGAYAQLPKLRQQVDSGTQSPALIASYDKLIAADLQIPQVVAQATPNIALQEQLRTYQAALEVGEYASQERAAVAAAIFAHGFTPTGFANFATAVAMQRQWEGAYALNATPAQQQLLQGALSVPAAAQVHAQRAIALAWPATHVLPSSLNNWKSVASARVNAINAIQQPLGTDLAHSATQQYSSASLRAQLVIALGLAGLLAALLLTLVLVRRIVFPLRALTTTARNVSEELPRMVERMQEPGADPQMQVETIPVRGDDEIGRLADAFNTVNAMTVRVAQEQAVLRGSIAEMFINVARRNQVLLSRQLSFIDDLEQREEDPDTLDHLFRLDHLATRMRRNSESLLVLAGINASRRLRRPVPLADVIRTAVGEIENYNRIDLSAEADPAVSGRVALAVAHLLAELLENATNFSSPETRVEVRSRWDNAGYVLVTVTDSGLGMVDEELQEVNERLTNPPVTNVALAQRLGFLVVGRLARRLEANVTLWRNPAGGTVASVLLPPSVLERNERPQELDGGQHQEPGHARPAGVTAPRPVVPATPPVPAAFVPASTRQQAPVTPAPAVPVLEPSAVARVQEPDLAGQLPQRGRNAQQVEEPVAASRIEPFPTPSPLGNLPAGNLPAGGLPTRRAVAEEQQSPAPVAVVAPILTGAMPDLGQAVQEHYQPAFQPPVVAPTPAPITAGGLRRRTPGQSAPAPLLEPEPAAATGVRRSPNEVRSSLSAFRAGVDRGRGISGPRSLWDDEEEEQL